MAITSEICDTLVQEFELSAKLQDVDFVKAYEIDIKPVPVNKPIVALSIKKCKVGDKVIETQADGKETVTNKRTVLTTVSVNIYTPYSLGTAKSSKIFDQLVKEVLFHHDSSFCEAICYETNYERTSQALVTKTDFVLNSVC